MRHFNTDNPDDVAALLELHPPDRRFEYKKLTKYGSGRADRLGFRPVEDVPDVLVSKDSFKEVIQHCHDQQIFPMYHQTATWAPDGYEYDQDGLGYCHTADTQVLTQRGWVDWPSVVQSDVLGTVNQFTHALEFQAPIVRQAFEYDGEMVYSTNRRIDFGVTPNHRMYVRKFYEPTRSLDTRYQFVTAENLGWYAGLLHAPSGFLGTELVEVEIPGDRRYDGDDFVAMLAIIISDGFAGGTDNRKTRNLVSFACFRPEDYNRVSALAARVGFAEQKSRSGVWHRWDARALANWIRANCYTGELGAQNKRIPDIVKCLSERQIRLFLSTYHDQCHAKPMSAYYTTSKQCVDDLQELLLRIGKRATTSWQDGANHRLCTLVVSDTDRLCIDKKKHIEQDRYKGLVYCATVPNSTLVTRRNGSVLISGNCWTWGGTGAVMTTRAMEDKDTVPLAPVSMGYLVNWRNEGNYLESFIDGAREDGICPAPDGNINSWKNSRSYWAEYEDQRKLYRLDAIWDCDPSSDSRMLQHSLSILAYGRPLFIAFNWWGHALHCVGMKWSDSAYLNCIPIIRNSHGEDDYITIEGSKSVFDEAYGFISTVPV